MATKCQRKGSRVKICAAPPTVSSRRSPDPYSPHPSRFWPVPPILVAYQDSSYLFLRVDKVAEPLPMMDTIGRYHLVADDLAECPRLIRELRIDRYWGGYAS